MTLTEFLTARLDEDEAVALAALAPDQMHPWGDVTIPPVKPDQVPDEMRGYLGGTWGEHAARWDMTRVLADVAAKRAIVAEWRTAQGEAERGDLSGKIAALAFMLAIQHLAQPFAAHPDFDPAWKVNP